MHRFDGSDESIGGARRNPVYLYKVKQQKTLTKKKRRKS